MCAQEMVTPTGAVHYLFQQNGPLGPPGPCVPVLDRVTIFSVFSLPQQGHLTVLFGHIDCSTLKTESHCLHLYS
jgi:hypothetical protein